MFNQILPSGISYLKHVDNNEENMHVDNGV